MCSVYVQAFPVPLQQMHCLDPSVVFYHCLNACCAPTALLLHAPPVPTMHAACNGMQATADTAGREFPVNTVCKTTHSLAYREMIADGGPLFRRKEKLGCDRGARGRRAMLDAQGSKGSGSRIVVMHHQTCMRLQLPLSRSSFSSLPV